MLAFSIALVTLISLVSSSYVPRAVPSAYKLQTNVIRGNKSLNGLFGM